MLTESVRGPKRSIPRRREGSRFQLWCLERVTGSRQMEGWGNVALHCSLMPTGHIQERHMDLLGIYQKESNVIKIKAEDAREIIMRVISASQRDQLVENTKLATAAAQYLLKCCNFSFISSLCFSSFCKKHEVLSDQTALKAFWG